MLQFAQQNTSNATGTNRSAAAQASPVDLKHLSRYTMGDKALEKEILELFLGQLPQTIEALKSAATERDWRIAAHTLKGSGRAVGAWHVARLAEYAERELTLANSSGCADVIARIHEAAEEARAFIHTTYAVAS